MTLALLDQIRLDVDYIEEQLGEDIDLRSISRAAGMSHSSFQRAFKAVTGETVKSYVRNRRLGQALDLLETTDLRVFEAAMGVTPTQYRRGHRARAVLKKVRIDDQYLEHLDSGGLSIEPVIEEREACRFVGVRTQFDGQERQRNTLGADIDDLWAQFLPDAVSVPDQIDGPYFGVIHDTGGDAEGLGYLAAVQSTVEAPPDGLDLVTIPAGRWAVFAHQGLPADIDHTVNYIYGSWLASSHDDHAGGPDLEIYGPDWKYDSPESVIHYAIPLRPSAATRDQISGATGQPHRDYPDADT